MEPLKFGGRSFSMNVESCNMKVIAYDATVFFEHTLLSLYVTLQNSILDSQTSTYAQQITY